MFLNDVMENGAMPGLIKSLAFNEARLRTIADNIANIHTPGYRAKQLDPAQFRSALRQALDDRKDHPDQPFQIKADRQVATDRHGYLRVTPRTTPVDHALFHDGTNLSLEREMAALAETGMAHEMQTELLRGRFDGYRKAIRGTV